MGVSVIQPIQPIPNLHPMTTHEEFYHLYTDGGCSPNPGPASASGVCVNPSFPARDRVLFAYSEYLGNATNNIGELTAIWRGLERALEHSITRLTVYSDSELSLDLCRKTKKTTKPHLQSLVDKIHALIPKFTILSFTWVEAHNNHLYNEFADQLCTTMLQRVAQLATGSRANPLDAVASVEPAPKRDTKLTLNCPFQEKDEAKALGARWDAKHKKWTVQDTPENHERFKKWLSS